MIEGRAAGGLLATPPRDRATLRAPPGIVPGEENKKNLENIFGLTSCLVCFWVCQTSWWSSHARSTRDRYIRRRPRSPRRRSPRSRPRSDRSGSSRDRSDRKSRICIHWERGHCGKGENCTFAHGAHELNSVQARVWGLLVWKILEVRISE